MPLRNFQDWALEQVRSLIPFDSAWWGNAAIEPMKIHWLHLYNCDKSIARTYPPYMADDFFRAAIMASPGTSINMSDLTTRALCPYGAVPRYRQALPHRMVAGNAADRPGVVTVGISYIVAE